MIKTQIQLPENLHREAKRVAQEREMSFAEVVRRGIEYITRIYPPVGEEAQEWTQPTPKRMGRFLAPVEDWRLLANEQPDTE